MKNDNWKKNAIKFLMGQTISLFGSSIVQYAIIWHITLTTSSGIMMSISTICGYVPQIAISMFAGVWLDRYNKKKIIMLADGVIAASTLLIGILFLCGYQSIWLLFGVLIIRSVGTGIQTPGVNAFIPEIVPKEYLMKVNGINSTFSSIMVFVSPAISGVILSITSIEVTFFVDIITAIIGIGIMFTIKVDRFVAVGSKNKSALRDIREGIIYLKNNKFFKDQIYYLIVVAVLVTPSAFLTPLLVSRAFGAEVWKLTVTQMAFSIGGALGGVLIATWGGFKNKRKTIIFSTIFYGAMMIAMGASKVFIVYLTFNFLIGISMPCYNTPVNVSLQENIEKDMHGRVFSMVQIANACAFPLGIVFFGPLADIMSVQNILIINGTILVTFALFSFKSKRFFIS